MTRRKAPAPASSLSWQSAKDNFSVWAIGAMLAFASYNLHELASAVSQINNKVTELVAVNNHHAYRLDQQLGRIVKIEEVQKTNGERIAKLEVEVVLRK